jgi:predicted TIM-barrel fold metal-dependent hydrolase
VVEHPPAVHHPDRTQPSRRAFLKAIATAGTGVAAGCATRPGAASPLATDTHTHFYDPSRPGGVPWPSPSDPLLFRTVLPVEYRALAEPLGIGAAIVVEASPRLEDNDWLLALGARHRAIAGVIGHLKPGLAGFQENLARLAGNRLFRGIRINLWNTRASLDDSRFLRDLGLLADRDLTLDVLGGPDDLLPVAWLSDRVRGLRVVVNHCANVRVDGGDPPTPWLEGIRECGSRPDITMKVSGLVEGTGMTQGQAPADTEFYRPVLDAVWSAFGEERVVFGSNWPVCERYAPLSRVHAIVAEYVGGISRTAERRFFHENAARVYGT